MGKYINPHKGIVMVTMPNGQVLRLGSHQMMDLDDSQAARLGLISVDEKNQPTKVMPGILPANPMTAEELHRKAAIAAASKANAEIKAAMTAGARASFEKVSPIVPVTEVIGEESKPTVIDEKEADKIAKSVIESMGQKKYKKRVN